MPKVTGLTFPDLRLANDMTLAEASLFYARAGFRVLLLEEKGKAPHPHIAKGWTSTATRDPKVVKQWWTMFPEGNIGIMPDEDFVVLDLDTKGEHSGVEAFKGVLEGVSGPIAMTASGTGRHRLFRGNADDDRIRNYSPRKGGFDLLVRSRQAVLAPSVVNGAKYQWTQGGEPQLMPTEVLNKVIEIARTKDPREKSPEDVPEIPSDGVVINHVPYDLNTDDRSEGMFDYARYLYRHFGDRTDADIMATVWSVDEYQQAATGRRGNEDSALDWMWKYSVWPAKGYRVIFPGDDRYDPLEPNERARIDRFIGSDGMPKNVGFDGVIKSSAQFAVEFVPPTYICRRISLQTGQLVTLTAHPGHFKTGVALEVSLRLAMGTPLDGVENKPRRVLYFAGENNNDNRLRFILTCLDESIDPSDVDIDWVDRAFQMDEASAKAIIAEAKNLGKYDLIVVDTIAAYFGGENENDNTEMQTYMQNLRKLTEVEGRPCVMVLAHPAKNAGPDDLKPRGGSSVYGTIDGNITLWMDKGIAKLHHSKLRGATFAPLYWKPKTLRNHTIKDTDGVEMPSVRAETLSQTEVKVEEDRDELTMLDFYRENPKGSQAKCKSLTGFPGKAKINKLNALLLGDGYLRSTGEDRNRKYEITQDGIDRLEGKVPPTEATGEVIDLATGDVLEVEKIRKKMPNW